jgi:hypothetical protein
LAPYSSVLLIKTTASANGLPAHKNLPDERTFEERQLGVPERDFAMLTSTGLADLAGRQGGPNVIRTRAVETQS